MTREQKHENRILTIKEVSEYLKIPLSTAYLLVKRGILPGTKLGRHWRFLEQDIVNFFRRTTALSTVIAFFLTSLGVPSPKLEAAEMSTPAPPFIPLDQIQIPAELGTIQETYQPRQGQAPALKGPGPFGSVILIQDAHAIPRAQLNIQKLIEYFQSSYGINLVALEGADDRLDPQIFKSFPDKELLKTVFKEYLERGELTGGTAAAIFSDPHPTPLPEGEGSLRPLGPIGPEGVRGTLFTGVEDWSLYEEGVSLYLQAMKREPQILKELEARRSKVEGEKEKTYSKELLEIDRALEEFRKNQTDLVGVLKVLKKYDVGAGLPRPEMKGEETSPLQTLMSEIEKEGEDTSLIEIEVKELAQKIKKSIDHSRQSTVSKGDPWTMDRGLWTDFNAKYQEFQTSRISPEAFALWMKEQILKGPGPFSTKDVKRGLAPSGFRFSPRLSRLMENQKRMQEIKGTKLFEDFEAYAESVKESLFRSEEEKKLDAESGQLNLFAKLANLELSRAEWDELKELNANASSVAQTSTRPLRGQINRLQQSQPSEQFQRRHSDSFQFPFPGGLDGHAHQPKANDITIKKPRASLPSTGLSENHTETKEAPVRISDTRNKDLAIASRRYGSNMKNSLQAEADDVKQYNHILIDLNLYKSHLSFYENAEKREEAMLKNLTRDHRPQTTDLGSSRMGPGPFSAGDEKRGLAPFGLESKDTSLRSPVSGLRSALLVAGGFHTEGIAARLKEQGISYVVVTPKIDSIPDQTNYRAHMRGEVSWKEYFRVENGKVNLYEAFVRAARDRLLQGHQSPSHQVTSNTPSPFPLPVGERVGVRGKKTGDPVTGDLVTLKSWRDQIIRDLANKNEITKAGQYTKFIDELAETWDRSIKTKADLSHVSNDLRTKWMANVERFIEGLRGLESSNRLTQENILNLLQLSAIPEKFVNPEVLVADGSVPVSYAMAPVTPTEQTDYFELTADGFDPKSNPWLKPAGAGETLVNTLRSEVRANKPEAEYLTRTLEGRELHILHGLHGATELVSIFNSQILPLISSDPENWLFLVEGKEINFPETVLARIVAANLRIPIEEPIIDYFDRAVVDRYLAKHPQKTLLDVYGATSLSLIGAGKPVADTIRDVAIMSGLSPQELNVFITMKSLTFAVRGELEKTKQEIRQINDELLPMSNTLSAQLFRWGLRKHSGQKKVFIYVGSGHLPIFEDQIIDPAFQLSDVQIEQILRDRESIRARRVVAEVLGKDIGAMASSQPRNKNQNQRRRRGSHHDDRDRKPPLQDKDFERLSEQFREAFTKWYQNLFTDRQADPELNGRWADELERQGDFGGAGLQRVWQVAHIIKKGINEGLSVEEIANQIKPLVENAAENRRKSQAYFSEENYTELMILANSAADAVKILDNKYKEARSELRTEGDSPQKGGQVTPHRSEARHQPGDGQARGGNPGVDDRAQNKSDEPQMDEKMDAIAERSINEELTQRAKGILTQLQNRIPTILLTILPAHLLNRWKAVSVIVSDQVPTFGSILHEMGPRFKTSPVILLNGLLVNKMTDAQLAAVLGHELGHVWLNDAHYTARNHESVAHALELLWLIEQRADMIGLLAVNELFGPDAMEEFITFFDLTKQLRSEIEALKKKWNVGADDRGFDVHMPAAKRQEWLRSIKSLITQIKSNPYTTRMGVLDLLDKWPVEIRREPEENFLPVYFGGQVTRRRSEARTSNQWWVIPPGGRVGGISDKESQFTTMLANRLKSGKTPNSRIEILRFIRDLLPGIHEELEDRIMRFARREAGLKKSAIEGNIDNIKDSHLSKEVLQFLDTIEGEGYEIVEVEPSEPDNQGQAVTIKIRKKGKDRTLTLHITTIRFFPNAWLHSEGKFMVILSAEDENGRRVGELVSFDDKNAFPLTSITEVLRELVDKSHIRSEVRSPRKPDDFGKGEFREFVIGGKGWVPDPKAPARLIQLRRIETQVIPFEVKGRKILNRFALPDLTFRILPLGEEKDWARPSRERAGAAVADVKFLLQVWLNDTWRDLDEVPLEEGIPFVIKRGRKPNVLNEDFSHQEIDLEEKAGPLAEDEDDGPPRDPQGEPRTVIFWRTPEGVRHTVYLPRQALSRMMSRGSERTEGRLTYNMLTKEHLPDYLQTGHVEIEIVEHPEYGMAVKFADQGSSNHTVVEVHPLLVQEYTPPPGMDFHSEVSQVLESLTHVSKMDSLRGEKEFRLVSGGEVEFSYERPFHVAALVRKQEVAPADFYVRNEKNLFVLHPGDKDWKPVRDNQYVAESGVPVAGHSVLDFDASIMEFGAYHVSYHPGTQKIKIANRTASSLRITFDPSFESRSEARQNDVAEVRQKEKGVESLKRELERIEAEAYRRAGQGRDQGMKDVVHEQTLRAATARILIGRLKVSSVDSNDVSEAKRFIQSVRRSEVRAVSQASPTARARRRSISRWMAGLSEPSLRSMWDWWRQISLMSLKVEADLRPVFAKSGWFGVSIKSVGKGSPEGMTEEIKATSTSSLTAFNTTAGRTLVPERSVKGKGTRTMSPRERLDFTQADRLGLSTGLRQAPRETGNSDPFRPASQGHTNSGLASERQSRHADVRKGGSALRASNGHVQKQLQWDSSASSLLKGNRNKLNAAHDKQNIARKLSEVNPAISPRSESRIDMKALRSRVAGIQAEIDSKILSQLDQHYIKRAIYNLNPAGSEERNIGDKVDYKESDPLVREIHHVMQGIFASFWLGGEKSVPLAKEFLARVDSEVIQPMREAHHPWALVLTNAEQWLAFQTMYYIADENYTLRTSWLRKYVSLETLSLRYALYGSHLRNFVAPQTQLGGDDEDFRTLSKYFKELVPVLEAQPSDHRRALSKRLLMGSTMNEIPKEYASDYGRYFKEEMVNRLGAWPVIEESHIKQVLKNAFEDVFGNLKGNEIAKNDPRLLPFIYFSKLMTYENILQIIEYNQTHSGQPALSLEQVVDGAPAAVPYLQETYDKEKVDKDFTLKEDKALQNLQALAQYAGFDLKINFTRSEARLRPPDSGEADGAPADGPLHSRSEASEAAKVRRSEKIALSIPKVENSEELNLGTVLTKMGPRDTYEGKIFIPDANGRRREFEVFYGNEWGRIKLIITETLESFEEANPDSNPIGHLANRLEFRYAPPEKVLGIYNVNLTGADQEALRANSSKGYAGAYAAALSELLKYADGTRALVGNVQSRRVIDEFLARHSEFKMQYSGRFLGLIPHSIISQTVLGRGMTDDFVNVGVKMLGGPEKDLILWFSFRRAADELPVNPSLAYALKLEEAYRQTQTGAEASEVTQFLQTNTLPFSEVIPIIVKFASRSEMREVASHTIDYFLGRPVQAAELASNINLVIKEVSLDALIKEIERVRNEVQAELLIAPQIDGNDVLDTNKVDILMNGLARAVSNFMAEKGWTPDRKIAMGYQLNADPEMDAFLPESLEETPLPVGRLVLLSEAERFQVPDFLTKLLRERGVTPMKFDPKRNDIQNFLESGQHYIGASLAGEMSGLDPRMIQLVTRGDRNKMAAQMKPIIMTYKNVMAVLIGGQENDRFLTNPLALLLQQSDDPAFQALVSGSLSADGNILSFDFENLQQALLARAEVRKAA